LFNVFIYFSADGSLNESQDVNASQDASILETYILETSHTDEHTNQVVEDPDVHLELDKQTLPLKHSPVKVVIDLQPVVVVAEQPVVVEEKPVADAAVNAVDEVLEQPQTLPSPQRNDKHTHVSSPTKEVIHAVDKFEIESLASPKHESPKREVQELSPSQVKSIDLSPQKLNHDVVSTVKVPEVIVSPNTDSSTVQSPQKQSKPSEIVSKSLASPNHSQPGSISPKKVELISKSTTTISPAKGVVSLTPGAGQVQDKIVSPLKKKHDEAVDESTVPVVIEAALENSLVEERIKLENVALLRDENVLHVKENNIPLVKEANIPLVKEENIPHVKEKNVPLVNEDDVPLVNEEDIPLINEKDVPLLKEENVPLVKDEDAPLIKEENDDDDVVIVSESAGVRKDGSGDARRNSEDVERKMETDDVESNDEDSKSAKLSNDIKDKGNSIF